VNAALFVLKRRKGELPGQFEVPLFVTAAGDRVPCADRGQGRDR